MATQLTIVNAVLDELREDPVSSVNSTSYSKLIGIFVNRAKEWMEDINHSWSVYITEVDTTITADSSTTTFNVSGSTYRSVLLRDQDHDAIPAIYDNTSGEAGPLRDCPYGDLLKQRILVNDTAKTVTVPGIFSIIPQSDGSGWAIEIIWPVTTGETARSWRSYWYIPQAKLTLTGSDDSTNIKLPREVIELRALYYALNERGEEMGQPGGLASQNSRDALGSALERDQQVQERGTKGDSRDWNNREYL